MSNSTLTSSITDSNTLEDLEFAAGSRTLDELETGGHDAHTPTVAGVIPLVLGSAFVGFLLWMFTADWKTLNMVTNLMYQPETASFFTSVRIAGAAVFLTSAALSIPKVSITTAMLLARHWWIPVTAVLAVGAYPAINFLTCMAQAATPASMMTN